MMPGGRISISELGQHLNNVMRCPPRMRLIFSFFTIACWLQAASAQDGGLCQADERVIFSCNTQNGKIVSFCGSSPAAKSAYAEYRYGKTEKVELRYRAAAGASKKIFFFDGSVRESRAVPNPTIFFKNGRYGYFLSALYSPTLKAYEAPTLFVNIEGADYLDSANEFACVEDNAGKGIFTMDLDPLHPALTPVSFPSFKAWQARFRRANSYHVNP